MFSLVSKLIILSLLVTSINRHVTMAIGHLNSPIFLTICLWFPEFG